MGRKQHIKQQRKQTLAPKVKVKPQGPVNYSWLIGVLVFFAVVITAIVMVVQNNKPKLLKMGLTAYVQSLTQELDRNQGKFSWDENLRLREVLQAAGEMSGREKLDSETGGRLNFLLRVEDEIIRQGQLEPGELEKLKNLLAQIQNAFERKLPAKTAVKP